MTFESQEFIDTLLIKCMEPDREYQSVHNFMKGELLNGRRKLPHSTELLNSIYLHHQKSSTSLKIPFYLSMCQLQ